MGGTQQRDAVPESGEFLLPRRPPHPVQAGPASRHPAQRFLLFKGLEDPRGAEQGHGSPRNTGAALVSTCCETGSTPAVGLSSREA